MHSSTAGKDSSDCIGLYTILLFIRPCWPLHDIAVTNIVFWMWQIEGEGVYTERLFLQFCFQKKACASLGACKP